MDPHWFYADPDPAIFLNADPGGKINADPCGQILNKINSWRVFLVVKYIKDYSTVRNNEALCKFTLKIE